MFQPVRKNASGRGQYEAIRIASSTRKMPRQAPLITKRASPQRLTTPPYVWSPSTAAFTAIVTTTIAANAGESTTRASAFRSATGRDSHDPVGGRSDRPLHTLRNIWSVATTGREAAALGILAERYSRKRVPLLRAASLERWRRRALRTGRTTRTAASRAGRRSRARNRPRASSRRRGHVHRPLHAVRGRD